MSDVAQLIAMIRAANEELEHLLRDRDPSQRLGAPCDSVPISRVQQYFGRKGAPIPLSYLEFLRLHDGWKAFFGELNLIGATDLESAWVREVAQLSARHMGQDDPFQRGAPLALAPDSTSVMVMFDLDAVHDGEAEVVVYHQREEGERYPSFRDYLEAHAERLLRLIDRQKHGDPTS